MNGETGKNNMWVTGYLRGFKVSFTIELRDNALGHDAISALNALVGVGFVALEAGANAGEETLIATHVLRMMHEKDGVITPVIDFWDERGKFHQIKAYLNTDEQIAEFERECGVKLASLPLYEQDGVTSIERGKSKIAFQKMVKLPHSVVIYYMPYEAKDIKGEPQTRKRYVRCVRGGGPSTLVAPTQNATPQTEAPRNPEPPQGDVHVHATAIARKHSTNGQRDYFTLTLATDTPTPSVNTNNIQLLHTANIHTTDLTEQVTVFPYPLELIIHQTADNNGKLWWNVKQFLDKLPESHWANDDDMRVKTAAYLSEKCHLPALTFKDLMDCIVQDKPPSDFATHKDFCQYFVNYQKVHPEAGIQYRNAYTDAQRTPADDDISNIPF